jgi:hypothetical protein
MTRVFEEIEAATVARHQADTRVRDAAEILLDGVIESPGKNAQVPQECINRLRFALALYHRCNQRLSDAYLAVTPAAERAAAELMGKPRERIF